MENGSPATLTETAVDSQGSELWSETPNVVKGDAGKVEAPAEGQTAPEYSREAAVAAVLATVETFVAVTPHAIH